MWSSGMVIPCPASQSRLRLALAGLAMIQKRVSGLADVRFKDKFAEVFEAGEALDGDVLETVPDENHEAESVMARSALRSDSR